MFAEIERTFGGLDILVLNASGGMESGMAEDYALLLNRDAQVRVLEAALPLLREGSRVVFVTSHQAHFIRTTPTMPEYEPVALSKRAGEDALRALIPSLERAGRRVRRRLGRHDRGHHHRDAARARQPGCHRRPPRGCRASSTTSPEFAAEVAPRPPGCRYPADNTRLVGDITLVRGEVSDARAATSRSSSRSDARRSPPDGSFAVFATSRPDLDANRAVGQLWRVDLPDGTPRRLTRGARLPPPSCRPTARAWPSSARDAKGTPAGLRRRRGRRSRSRPPTPRSASSDCRLVAGRRTIACYLARIPEKAATAAWKELDAAAEAPRHITGIRWHANGLGYIGDRPAHVFVVAAPETDSEPFYEPAPPSCAEDETPPKKTVVAVGGACSSPRARPRTAVWRSPRTAREVLTGLDEIEPDRRDLRNAPDRPIAVDGSGERERARPRRRPLAVRDIVGRADDGTIALLAHEVGPEGVDFIAPGVALWLLEEGGPRRITDAETIDLGEVGSHITAIGDDFLVQDRTRGRVRLLRVGARRTPSARSSAATSRSAGHAAAGDRIVAAVACPDSYGELVLVVDGRARAP